MNRDGKERHWRRKREMGKEREEMRAKILIRLESHIRLATRVL